MSIDSSHVEPTISAPAPASRDLGPLGDMGLTRAMMPWGIAWAGVVRGVQVHCRSFLTGRDAGAVVITGVMPHAHGDFFIVRRERVGDAEELSATGDADFDARVALVDPDCCVLPALNHDVRRVLLRALGDADLSASGQQVELRTTPIGASAMAEAVASVAEIAVCLGAPRLDLSSLSEIAQGDIDAGVRRRFSGHLHRLKTDSRLARRYAYCWIAEATPAEPQAAERLVEWAASDWHDVAVAAALRLIEGFSVAERVAGMLAFPGPFPPATITLISSHLGQALSAGVSVEDWDSMVRLEVLPELRPALLAFAIPQTPPTLGGLAFLERSFGAAPAVRIRRRLFELGPLVRGDEETENAWRRAVGVGVDWVMGSAGLDAESDPEPGLSTDMSRQQLRWLLLAFDAHMALKPLIPKVPGLTVIDDEWDALVAVIVESPPPRRGTALLAALHGELVLPYNAHLDFLARCAAIGGAGPITIAWRLVRGTDAYLIIEALKVLGALGSEAELPGLHPFTQGFLRNPDIKRAAKDAIERICVRLDIPDTQGGLSTAEAEGGGLSEV